MATYSVIPAKQQRSQDTQRNLMSAVHYCLQSKFFEHISIKELCDYADVSVGTFYRRFKNKEALLPLLYQDFGQDLIKWIDTLALNQYTSLSQAVKGITQQTHEFFMANRSLFRTIHLNSRLHSNLVAGEALVDRREVYRRIAQILLRFSDEISAQDKKSAVNMVIFAMIAALLDKVLYPQITPAIACDFNSHALCGELSKMLMLYLSNAE